MNKTATTRVTKMCLSAMFIAIGWILPLLSGQNQELGNMLCLMHIPVFVAGFILGPQYGIIVGAVTPLTRFLIFGRPPIYPTGLCMAFELAAYGFLSGFIFRLLVKKNVNELLSIYVSLVGAMVVGRLVWGISRALCGIVSQSTFTWKMFITAGFVTAIPGILIQLFLIPALVMILNKVKKI